MKKLLISLIVALTWGAAWPTFAGPDWQAIEQARKAKQATERQRHAEPHEAQGPTAAGPKCPPDTPVLQLDHGPRAQTTPYLNRFRKERYEEQVTACKGVAK